MFCVYISHFTLENHKAVSKLHTEIAWCPSKRSRLFWRGIWQLFTREKSIADPCRSGTREESYMQEKMQRDCKEARGAQQIWSYLGWGKLDINLPLTLLLMSLVFDKSRLPEYSIFKSTISWNTILRLSWCRNKFSEAIPDASTVSFHSHILCKYLPGQIFAYASILEKALCEHSAFPAQSGYQDSSNCELQVLSS